MGGALMASVFAADTMDEASALLIAHDPAARKLCQLAGQKHLAVPAKNMRAFRSALKDLGFVLQTPDR